MDVYSEALAVMVEQFGHDIVMSLATVDGSQANVRTVNAYYRDGAFYVTSYALSHKMKEIAANPSVALCHGLFVVHGRGTNLGNPLAAGNQVLRDELRQVFSAFYDRHVNEADPYTCILKVDLTDAVVFTANARYAIDWTSKSAEKTPFVNDIVY